VSFFQVSPSLIIYLNKNPSASSVAVERIFSKGRLLISHIRNRLSAQSTRALLCLGYWSKLDYIKLDDLKAAASLPDAKNDEDWSDEDWSIIA
jgi:hypothetical protein